MPMISEDTPIVHQDPLPDAADVVIIGAGVVGTATAYFLAGRGVRVVLCEKGRVAGEQSSRNWGWVRQQGRDRAELPIMMESRRLWRGLAEATGEKDLRFTECGCLYLAEDESQMASYESWYDIAREHQLDTRLLSKQEAASLVPDLSGSWTGGMLTPSDGRAEPLVAVPALARAARKRGAVVIESCAVRSVETRAGRVGGVVTEQGRVRADVVLLAGGAWSSVFATNLGLDLPQLIVRSSVARTNPAPARISSNVSAPGFTIRRREDGGFTVSTGDLAEHYVAPKSFRYFGKFLKLMKLSARDVRLKLGPPSGYPGAWSSPVRWRADEVSPFERMRVLDPRPSAEHARRLAARLPGRVPWLREAGIAESWAGMIDVTPDAVPYVGEVAACPGLFVGTGMSGHGFGIGPGFGQVLAELVESRAPGFDLTRFRFERFSDGSPMVPGPY